MKLIRCKGCRTYFSPTRIDQKYHSRRCGKTTWERRKRQGIPCDDVEVPVEIADWRKLLEQAQPPKTTIGYRLYCRELDLWLPIPGHRRLDGSRPRRDYYCLAPSVELPAVPLATAYQLVWVLDSGVAVCASAPLFVDLVVPFHNKDVVARLSAYKRNNRPALPLPADLAGVQPVRLNPSSDRSLLAAPDQKDRQSGGNQNSASDPKDDGGSA